LRGRGSFFFFLSRDWKNEKQITSKTKGLGMSVGKSNQQWGTERRDITPRSGTKEIKIVEKRGEPTKKICLENGEN